MWISAAKVGSIFPKKIDILYVWKVHSISENALNRQLRFLNLDALE
jgi:hypothetical protein